MSTPPDTSSPSEEPPPKTQDWGGASDSTAPDSLAGALGGGLRSLIWILRLALLLLLAVYLSSGITFIAPGESGLVLRLGRLLPEVHPPGLLLAWPRPIDRVVRAPGGQILELSIEEWEPLLTAELTGQPLPRAAFHPAAHGYTLTGDRNILQGLFTVRYRVVDPAAYALDFLQPEVALRELTLQALTHTLAVMRVDAALVEERQTFALTARQATQSAADTIGLGVEITALEIRELVPPVWVASAFQEVVNARVEADTLLQEAMDERARRMPEAEALAHRLREEALAQKRHRLLQAQAEATAFAEIRASAEENPELFRWRRHGETLALVLPRLRSTTVLAPQTSSAGLWLNPSATLHLPPLSVAPTRSSGTSILPAPAAPAVPDRAPFSPTLPMEENPETLPEMEDVSEGIEEWEDLPLPTWDSREEP